MTVACVLLLALASPPDAGTVQMSPPETNAISRWSGAIAGSENAGRAATGAGGRTPAGSKTSNETATAAENADARDARENATDDSKE